MPELPEPIRLFVEILDEARSLGIKNPDAMVLSTVDEEGRPSSRQVLLKRVDERGFVFYTNLESRKARHIAARPSVALNFYWRELDRQVHVEGPARPVAEETADAYFATRDRGSQLGAWASRQSRPLESRARLLAEVAKVEARHLGGAIPRPDFWSGFCVEPVRIEHWHAGAFRLHDRISWRLQDGVWTSTRLYP
ncbi:MAG: pyridoxamine 5'-phosphate oxidase [Thermoanaerobaculia bacterium]|nr:pyridoxamine 5'-phosphate oxidase [Thermoanaerobaculia bacterium]